MKRALRPADVTALARDAKLAAKRAYAPYSKFRVGAAVRAGSGKIYLGCNVENASYGLTSCAERNAIFAAVGAGESSIDAVVLYTPTSTVTSPCGACRQVLREFGTEIAVIAVCDGTDRLVTTLADLLPHGFGPENLG